MKANSDIKNERQMMNENEMTNEVRRKSQAKSISKKLVQKGLLIEVGRNVVRDG